jgi:hypothetical protein
LPIPERVFDGAEWPAGDGRHRIVECRAVAYLAQHARGRVGAMPRDEVTDDGRRERMAARV